MPRRLSKAAAQAELARRLGAVPALTPENIANGHLKQLELLRALMAPSADPSSTDSCLLVCARQVGKTELIIGAIALVMRATPNVECLYLGLNDKAAWKVFHRKWKPFCERFKLPVEHVGQTTRFTDNNSFVVFGGVDDAAHAASFLGGSMAGGLAAIDESQSQPAAIADVMRDVIEPMISQVTVDKQIPGKIIVAGTCPPVHAGFFWDLWRQGLDADLNIVPKSDEWLRVNMSRWDNPHLLNPRESLDKSNKRYKLTDDHPIQQRNFFGNYKVVDASITAFGWTEGNSYDGALAPWSFGLKCEPGKLIATIPPAGLDTFSIGADPAGSSDRYGLVCWGWSSKRPLGVWQVAEWATERAANAKSSEWLAVLKLLVEKYRPVVRIIRDDTAMTVDDVSLREYSLVIEPPKKGKGSKGDRIERMRDLLGTGRMHVLRGGALERDLQMARLDPADRAVGKYTWTSDIHPDLADAGSYGVAAYVEAPPPPTKLTTEQLFEEQFRAAYRPSTNYGWVDSQERQVSQYQDTSYGGPTD